MAARLFFFPSKAGISLFLSLIFCLPFGRWILFDWPNRPCFRSFLFFDHHPTHNTDFHFQISSLPAGTDSHHDTSIFSGFVVGSNHRQRQRHSCIHVQHGRQERLKGQGPDEECVHRRRRLRIQPPIATRLAWSQQPRAQCIKTRQRWRRRQPGAFSRLGCFAVSIAGETRGEPRDHLSTDLFHNGRHLRTADHRQPLHRSPDSICPAAICCQLEAPCRVCSGRLWCAVHADGQSVRNGYSTA